MLLERFNRARAYLLAPGLGPLFVRSLAGSSVVRILAMLATFGVGVQLARGLGVQGYGYYGLALSIVTIAGIPGELGLSKLVMREVSTANARGDDAALFGVLGWAKKVCWSISGLLAVAVAIAAGVLIARGSTTLGTALLFGIPTIPFMALSRINGGALQGLQYITLGQIPANLLRPLFLSVLLLALYLASSLSAPAAMAVNSATAVMVFLVAQAWLRKRRPRTGAAAVALHDRRWLASTIPLALTDGMQMLQLELTTVLLGAITLPADAGLFRLAAATAAMAAAPMVIIAHATMPMLAGLHAQEDHERLQKVVTYSALVQTVGVLVLSLPLLIVPKLLLSLVFGAGFGAAATALRIVAVAQIVNAAFGPNIILLNMTHQEKRVTRATAVGLVLDVVITVLLARTFGTIGGAIGFAASLMTWNLLLWYDARTVLGIETSALKLPSRR